ncbi:MAG: type II secretion system F family protein [Fimbriimonadaceae bacterium]
MRDLYMKGLITLDDALARCNNIEELKKMINLGGPGAGGPPGSSGGTRRVNKTAWQSIATFKDPSGGIQKVLLKPNLKKSWRARFQEQGLEIVEISMIKKGKVVKSRGFGKVKLAKLSVFCRQFSTMVDAGVSLVRCLDVLSRQTDDPKLKKILLDLSERVEGGESLSRAMQRHPRTFNNLFIGLIRAGEVGGVLEESLQRLSQFLESDVALRTKSQSGAHLSGSRYDCGGLNRCLPRDLDRSAVR